MAPPFESASIELDFPLYAIDFDTEDSNRLVVGGGGGAGRSGVGNKIAVLETTSQNEIQTAGDITLSRDEDSVMSLALGARKGKTTHLYAGVNSSPESIAKGTNEHLRTLAIELPKAREKAAGPSTKVSEISRTSMFTDPDENSYQRLLRVVGQLGVASTAMGKDPQIGIFEATGPNPKVKGVFELPREAEDLDVIQTAENEYLVAFCHKYELHVVKISKEQGDPELVYTMPDDHGEKPMFRSIRFLTPNFILAISNLPKKNGIIIQGLRLPKPGHETARLAVAARIPGKINATALSVTNLSPPANLTTPVTETQFLVAVAGNDSSVYVYTLEHMITAQLPLLVNLYPLTTLKTPNSADNLTGLAFSTFVAPKSNPRPQFVKLASISLQSTVSVYSIPLKKYVDKTPRNPKGPPRATRYVVAMKSQTPSSRPIIIIMTVIVLLLAIIGQAVMEVYGGSKPILHAHKILPSWHGTLRTPSHQAAALLQESFIANLVGGNEELTGETLILRDILPGGVDEEDEHNDEDEQYEGEEGDYEGEEDEEYSEVEQDGEAERNGEAEEDSEVEEEAPTAEAPTNQIRVDAHREADDEAKRWDELSEEHKEAWKEKLLEAGKWTRDMGEGVFKGILFGELAGAVGQAFAG
ncbi:hypothetical protein V2G26_013514 [Clonostachys chloroleuca]